MLTFKTFEKYIDCFNEEMITGHCIKMDNVVQYKKPENFDDNKYYLFVNFGMGKISANQMEFDNMLNGINTMITFICAYILENNMECLYGVTLAQGKELKPKNTVKTS